MRIERPKWWLSTRAHLVALFWACVVEVGLKTRPLPALAERLGTPLAEPDADRTSPAEATSKNFTYKEWIRLRAIDRVLRRWPFGDTCLRRSLVWGHSLRARSPRLQIGVARDGVGTIIAHSWLVFGDEMSLGLDPDVTYLPLGGDTN